MEGANKKEMEDLVGQILQSYQSYPQTCSINTRNRVNKNIVIDILEEIRSIAFPGFLKPKISIGIRSNTMWENCWRISSTA